MVKPVPCSRTADRRGRISGALFFPLDSFLMGEPDLVVALLELGDDLLGFLLADLLRLEIDIDRGLDNFLPLKNLGSAAPLGGAQ